MSFHFHFIYLFPAWKLRARISKIKTGENGLLFSLLLAAIVEQSELYKSRYVTLESSMTVVLLACQLV